MTRENPDEPEAGQGATPPLSKAARRALSYSAAVGRLKLVLPGIAVLLVAAVVAWPLIEERREAMLSSDEINVRADGLEMVAPNLSGLDDNGQPYKIWAERATSDGFEPNLVTLTRPQAHLVGSDGKPIEATAPTGLYRPKERKLTLDGGVEVKTGAGYVARLQTVEIDLAASTAASDRPVEAEGPAGSIRANGMDASDGGHTLRFHGAVHVVARPAAADAGQPTTPVPSSPESAP